MGAGQDAARDIHAWLATPKPRSWKALASGGD